MRSLAYVVGIIVIRAVAACAAAQQSPLGGAPNECGIVSLAVCLKLLGLKVSAEELRTALPASSYGSNMKELRQLAKAHGVYGRCVRTSGSDLLFAMSADQVAIVRSASRDHFFIVTGRSPDGAKVRCVDAGLLAIIDMTQEEFQKEFRGEALILSKRPINIPSFEGWWYGVATGVAGCVAAALILALCLRRRVRCDIG